MAVILPEFDELAEMARQDPEGLETLRQRLCNELIEQAPPHVQRRLRGLQFQIDAQRRLAKTPLQACMRISDMMHESFAELRAALHLLTGADTAQAQREPPAPARVLQFRASR
jgi:hypothetical protein